MNKEIKEDDVIEIYPSEKLMNDWKNGVSLDEIKKKLRKELEDDFTYELGARIAEEFYKKWDEDGMIRIKLSMGDNNE